MFQELNYFPACIKLHLLLHLGALLIESFNLVLELLLPSIKFEGLDVGERLNSVSVSLIVNFADLIPFFFVLVSLILVVVHKSEIADESND